MCVLKYGSWNIGSCAPRDVSRLTAAGYSPLAAAALCGRGCADPAAAAALLSCEEPLPDPFLMLDMDRAAARVRQALSRGERIAVYGDYDVDGITATCLLTEFFRGRGADCVFYIPSRLGEGYGLNRAAIAQLAAQGVTLLITVDCGITALDEARCCEELGVDLIITDHHECKGELPRAVAVVDPHRPGDPYPHQGLAGVGVAFKLAAAVCGDQAGLLEACADLVCLGTVADVMPLVGENRVFTARGLRQISRSPRPGLAALMRECECDARRLTAAAAGYILAPRINAAGRMGSVQLAVRLFLTRNGAEAASLAAELCQLNRRRQTVEAEIYAEAVEMLRGESDPAAIVLASEHWHQGVVGIVASRLSEEYRCPVFLICLDGERGKASSRSYGGFNLFGALESLSGLLESYGGHELAAGFTILRARVDEFREAVVRQAGAFRGRGLSRGALEIDCAVDPALLTLANVEALSELEPCGAGCPQPVFCIENMSLAQAAEVGGGRHLRMRLRSGTQFFAAIFFSSTLARTGLRAGDRVDVAFTPQINEFRGVRSVQLNVVDIRPTALAEKAESELYERCRSGLLSALEAGRLLPQRPDFLAVWRYLVAHAEGGRLEDECGRMSRSITLRTGVPGSSARTRVCLDVFAEQGLIEMRPAGRSLRIKITANGRKVDLEKSGIVMRLKRIKAGE